jgi:hypothetical protein
MASLKEGDIENLGETRALALIEACNSTIERLNKTLNQQSRQKHLLERRILTLRGNRSSLNRFPDELMLEIFKEASREDSLALGPILRVCRKWYNLAINSPSLWAVISLDLRINPNAVGIQRRMRFVESAIRSSKTALLDIDLTLPQEYNFVNDMVYKMLGIEDPGDEDGYSITIYRWLKAAFDRDPEGLPLYEELIEAISQFMTMLAGSKGENLLRLRRFKVDFDPWDFDALRWISALYHPTPNMEILEIDAGEYEGSDVITPFFTHPAPKLSFISINGRYSIDQLLCPDHPIDFLNLRFYNAPNFELFEKHQLLANLKHLCVEVIGMSALNERPKGSIFLPSLETLTTEGWACGTEYIKAPQLETLRVFGYLSQNTVLFSGPYFPSLRRLHCMYYIEKDLEALTTYIAQLPLLKEVVLSRDKAEAREVLSWMSHNSVYNRLTLKGYRTEYADFDSWYPPYPYERDERMISW